MSPLFKYSITVLVIILSVGALWWFNTGKENDSADARDPTNGDYTKGTITEIKQSIPLQSIVSGGPGKDGIPAIDTPRFISVPEASSFLSDTDPGVAVSLNGIDRFYPFQILVWHEIVNDTFEGQRVLVTYCPLCYTAIVFDPVVKGERVEFGVSGKLYESNLLMYDRKTESYWSQILGKAVVGEMTGETLPVLSSDILTFGNWRNAFPNGQALSRNTGADRHYGVDPYGNYYSNDEVFFRVSAEDSRLDKKDFILGILVNGKAKAYDVRTIKALGEITDTFEGKTFIARYDPTIDAVRFFEKNSDGALIRINPFGSFWFSWVAVHPDTELYKK